MKDDLYREVAVKFVRTVVSFSVRSDLIMVAACLIFWGDKIIIGYKFIVDIIIGNGSRNTGKTCLN